MRHSLPGAVRGAILGLALLPLAPAFGAGGPLRQFALRDSYQIGEGGATRARAAAADPAPESADSSAGAGPIRLARFSYVQGNVTWRASEGAAWSPATVNLPIRQGAQVWVTNGGRAEVQFDDGSLLRLGNGAVATLQTLFSDADGEFTEIQMNEGLSTLELRGTKSIYQVDTPLVSVKSEGPSKVRIGVDSDVEIAVRSGQAAVEGSGHKTVLESESYLDLTEANDRFNPARLPDPDSWDRWNDARDRQLADGDSGDRLPSNIALVAGNLDDYGSWHDDARYGSVWCPAVSDAGWRPYQHGHWTWVEPFGWTWVSSESWGWAPYHYGTWVSEPYGWAWVPGPARQPWCPAVVHFSEYDGAIAWAPLCPSEVRYPPALRLGTRGGNWSLSFSIGRAAVYYPYNDSYCTARPFNNVVVNRVTYVNNVTNVYNVTNGGRTDIRPTTAVNRNVYLNNTRFIPWNARNAAGVTTASMAAFGGRGEYQPAPRATTAFFTRGRSIGAPLAGSAPVAGPISARPTAMAFTPSRTFLSDARPASPILRRPLFRSALPPSVARFAPSSLRFQAFGSRPGATSFPRAARPAAPGAATGRPFGPRPETASEAGPLRSRRRQSRPAQGAPEPYRPEDQARQAALDARRSLGQHSGIRPGAVPERRSPGAPSGDQGAFRPSRPVRVFPSNTNPQDAPRDFPRSQNVPRDFPRSQNVPRDFPRSQNVPQEPSRPAREVPREPSRPEPSPAAPRPSRRRERPSGETQPQAPAPERTPRDESRSDNPQPAPSQTQPSSPNDHSGGRPGGRRRG